MKGYKYRVMIHTKKIRMDDEENTETSRVFESDNLTEDEKDKFVRRLQLAIEMIQEFS